MLHLLGLCCLQHSLKLNNSLLMFYICGLFIAENGLLFYWEWPDILYQVEFVLGNCMYKDLCICIYNSYIFFIR